MLALRMKRAVRNGATLVVADPRKIWLTKIAKRHLQLRPGTDVWLLNALMHVILEEGLQDEEYIREHTVDFDAVREVVSRYSPEEAERVTGVPAEDIRADRARVRGREARGHLLHARDHRARVRRRQRLVALEPRADDRPPRLRVHRAERAPRPEQRPGPERLRREPVVLPRLPAPRRPGDPREVRGALGRRGPGDARLPARPDHLRAPRRPRSRRSTWSARTRRRPSRTRTTSRRGSSSCEFMVAQDLFLNDSTRNYADVVFPASSFAEKDGTFTNTERRVNRVRKALDCPGEAREDWRIVFAFANALGAAGRVRVARGRLERVRRPLPELVRHPLPPDRGAGDPVAVHRPRPPGHAVPARAAAGAGGKGQFFPVEYQPPIEQPDSEYPFVLSTGRTLYHYNSATMTMREPGVTEKQEEPFFEIIARTRARSGSPTASSRGSSRAAARSRREAHVLRPRLPGARLDGAPLRPGEGELAHRTTSATR